MKREEKDLTDSKKEPMEEGRRITMAVCKESNNGGKTATLNENNSADIPIIFPPKLPDPWSFSISSIVGKLY